MTQKEIEEKIMLNCINMLIEHGESEDEILFTTLKNMEENFGKREKNKQKRLLQRLFQQVENPAKLAANNESKKELAI